MIWPEHEACDANSKLALCSSSVRQITPPEKDLRSWLKASATRDDVLATIEAATVLISKNNQNGPRPSPTEPLSGTRP